MSESKNKGGRPATGVTRSRSVRVGQVWDDAEAKAKKERGETMTDLIKRLLAEYVERA